MKNFVSATCVALAFGAGVSVFAQMDKKPMPPTAKAGEMAVSGCVAAGKDAGQYMLTNAMMMDKEHMKKPGMGADHMMTYELVGGELKPHVGHKVEVMGTMSKMDMDHMAKMGKMEPMGKDKMADKDMKAMKLTVASVKMVAATCP
jgi:hypothetical protein